MKIFTTITIAAMGLATPVAFADNAPSSTSSQASGSSSTQGSQQKQGSGSQWDSAKQSGQKSGQQGEHMSGQSGSMAAGGISQVLEEQKQQGLQSSDFVGATVTDGKEHVVGTISDIEMSQDGSAEAVYIDIGGILGIGSTTYRLPFDQIQVDQSQEELQLTISQDTLNNLASLSGQLRDDMQDWTEQAQEEMAEASEEAQQNLAEANQAAQDQMAAAGAQAGQGAQRAGQQMQQAAGSVSPEARQLKSDLQRQLQGNSRASRDLTAVNVRVDRDRVILDGSVRSEEARRDIVSAARDIADDREVVDNLRVSAAGTASID